MRACVLRSNPLKPEGEWITYIDLKQQGGELQLAKQPNYGKCQKVRLRRAPFPPSSRSPAARCDAPLRRRSRGDACSFSHLHPAPTLV